MAQTPLVSGSPGFAGKLLPRLIVAASIAAFGWAMISAAGQRLVSGNAYPEFSSLRADPEGAKLLFDSLTGMPGLSVERSFVPANDLASRDAAIFVLGLWPVELDDDEDRRHAFEEVARRGNRLVLGLRGVAPATPMLAKAWGIRFEADRAKEGSRRHVFVRPSKDWKILDGEETAAARVFGQGSIVICTDSSSFTNDATVAGARLALLAAVIGPARHIVFDEEHFGFAVSGSVAGLARHFRLTGLVFGLALAAALFLWKSSAGFPPPGAPETRALEGRTSRAGLATLLRRHIPASSLLRACQDAWLEANRHRVPAARLAEIESIVRLPGADPLASARRIRAALRLKGPS